MDNYQLTLLAQSLNLDPTVLLAIYNRYKPQTQQQLVSLVKSANQPSQSVAINFEDAIRHGYQFVRKSVNDLVGQCFTAGHLVTLSGGVYKNIEELEVGDEIISSDGKTTNIVLQKIARKSPTIYLKTSLSNFEVTPEHPFLTNNGFTEAQNLKKDDLVVVPVIYGKLSGLSDNELRWLGLWLGDGDTYKETGINSYVYRLTVSKNKAEYVNKLNIGSSKQFHSSHITTSIHTLQKRKHKLLSQILHNCSNNKEKQLPLIFSHNEYSKIIEGYLKADGYLIKDDYYEISSTSKKLVYALQIASLLSGYSTTCINIHKRKNKVITINGKKVKKVKPLYRLYLNQRKQNQFATIVDQKDNQDSIVYNITVSGDNTYICNNHAVHNCAWFAEQVTRLPDGSTWTIGNTIGEKLSKLNQHRLNGNAFFRGEAQPEVGQSVVIKTNGKYGHVAVINEVLPDGRLRLTESNWNNDLRVTHDRIINPNDQDVVGFLKTKPTSEFKAVPARTNPLTPTSPKTQIAQVQAPQDRQELPEEEQPVKVDDIKVGNLNARRLQQTTKLDNQNLESMVKTKPASSLTEQVQSFQVLTQPKPTPPLIKPFTEKPVTTIQKPQMSMETKPIIRKPPQMSQPVKQFKPPQMSVAPKMSVEPKIAMSINPTQKPQLQSKQVVQKKPILQSAYNKIKGYFT